jgi:aryl-alcohol dehydrogenase-like predicted oxidoreductase
MTIGRGEDLGSNRSTFAMMCRCHAVLDAADDAGIRYVDVARSYGLGEHFLNRWCETRRISPDRITIGSKWGYTYTGQWLVDATVHEVKALTIDTLQRQITESAAILGRRLSLYQIHSATLESGVLEDVRVLSELVRLRSQGLRIGLTVTGPRQSDVIRRALTVRVDGRPLFQTVQATWNLLEPSAAAALAEARAEGWGVIVKEVLANGRLTTRHADARLRDVRLGACARGLSVETLAIAAALQQPWADVVLCGALRSGHLSAPLAALAVEADDDMVPTVAERPEEYWRRRAALAWA